MPMSAFSFLVLVCLWSMKISTPQSIVQLDRTLPEVVCENEIQQFDCAVSGSSLQWIAEPFINKTGSSLIVFNNLLSENGSELFPSSSIRLVQFGVNPLRARMFVNGTLTRKLIVECVVAENELQSESYISGSLLVQPPFNVSLQPFFADFDNGHISLTFDRSPSPDLVGHDIFMNGNRVMRTNRTAENLEVPANIMGTEFEVCVCATNRCGTESRRICRSDSIKTIPGYAASVILLAVIGAGLLLGIPLFIVFIIIAKKGLNKNKTAADEDVGAISLEKSKAEQGHF